MLPADAGPARIILDQESYDFGSLRPDQSTMRTFTVTNTGAMESGALGVNVTGPGAAFFSADTTACQGQRLQPGTGCDIIITFTTATAGPREASLVVTATPGGTAMATLRGSGLSPAALSSDPTSAGFGTVTTGGTATIPLSIRNDGEIATGTLTTTIDGPDAARFSTSADTCKTKPLASASSCSVSVTFSPTVAGARSATLHIGDGTRAVDVPLSGSGVTPGALSLMPTTPTFADTALGSSTTATITVKNTGGTQVTGLTTSLSGGSASDFSRNPDNCNGQSLAAGASCTVTLRFQPTVAGAKSASFSVSASGGGSASTSFVANATARVTVTTAGNGSGSVASSPVGLQCATGSTNGCAFDFAAASVLLSAAAAGNSTFDGWSGGGCSGTEPCTVALSAAKNVTATFSLRRYTVTVNKTGNGRLPGRVTSPAGVDCGDVCSIEVLAGQSITLTATDTPMQSQFAGWSGGGCSGTGTCTTTPTSSTTITADFKSVLNVMVWVNGCWLCQAMRSGGRVLSSPARFDVQSVDGEFVMASDYVVEGTNLEFTAIPGTGALFGGWVSEYNADVVAKYTAAYQATRHLSTFPNGVVWAIFGRPVTVSVSVGGAGGTVTSIPPGIACNAGTCNGSFAQDSVILLRAERSATWSEGACGDFFPPRTSTGMTCEVVVGAGKAVTVDFP